VALLHGGHGAWSHWIRNIPTLSQRYTLIVPDMPGFAESASPAAPYTADSMAAIMAAGLDCVLDTHKVSIVGFSFGGVIGGTLAKHVPDRIERLVLVGSGGLGLPRPKLGEMKNWRQMEAQDDRLEAHRHNLATLMLQDPANIDALALHLQSTNTVRTRINSRAISMTDTLRRSLMAFDAPLAGIWGTHDATVMEFLDSREELLRSLDADAEFVRIPGGHWIQYEAPQAFDAAVTKVLETKRARRGKPA
jgi:2-hydroxy-6-oxonona-2,4-dienedioate hydrolase